MHWSKQCIILLKIPIRCSSVNRNTKIGLKKIATKEIGLEFAYRKKTGFGLPLEKIVNDKRFIEKVYDEYIDEIIAIFALGAFKSSFK